MTKGGIEQARVVAASFLRAKGCEADARTVLSGGGDDFPEVRLALAAASSERETVTRLERALHCYADPTFWDVDAPEASLAFYDRGEIARAALAGKELFASHRD